MRIKRMLIVLGAVALSVVCAGCGRNKEKNTDTEAVTSEEMELSTPGDGLTEYTDSAEEETVRVGYYEGEDTYVNDSFGVTAVLPEGWTFGTSEEVANATGKTVEEIEGMWNGDKSVYESEVTYLFIAYNSNGSNVIMNYCTPALYGTPDLTAKEYLESASESYPDSELTVETLNAKQYDCLKLPNDNGCKQEMYCVDKDGVILMITFTVMDGETDDYYSLIK